MTTHHDDERPDGAELPDAWPMHTKLAGVRAKTEAIHEWLEWLAYDHDTHLATPMERGGDFAMRMLLRHERDELLARFHGIDLKVLELEKRAMLDQLRAMNDQAAQAVGHTDA